MLSVACSLHQLCASRFDVIAPSSHTSNKTTVFASTEIKKKKNLTNPPRAQDPGILDEEIFQAEKAQAVITKKETTDQFNHPGWYSKLTRRAPGKFPALSPCRLSYVMSWAKIVKSGEAVLTYGAEAHKDFPGLMIARSKGKSAGLARTFWKYDYSFFSAIDQKQLRSVSFFSKERDSGESLITSNRYDSKGLLCEQRMEVFATGDVYDRRERFPYSEARDLLSTALYLRSLDWKQGDRIIELVHPFDGPYLLELTCLGKENHLTGLVPEGELPCFKIEVNIRKINDDLQLTNYAKFKKAIMWVSDDKYRLPIDIKAQVFIGDIHCTLVERQPLAANRETASEEAQSRELVSEIQKMENEND